MDSVLVEHERADDAPAGNEDKDGVDVVGHGCTVHRLRDLDRRHRAVAAAFGLALLLAPLLAFARYLPDWAPAGDPALMALRALDVGTSRTPLLGQPSTAATYVDATEVHHLGPLHFYMMAPLVRLLGVSAGMLVVSVLITGSSLVVAVWATFRQLGLLGGAVAAAVLGTISFTTGAASLVNPVSSNIAGYPLLCSAVLLWCLLCGDLRLLPLTAVWVSFTAQQHLSVLPALAVLTVVPVVGCVVLERRNRGLLVRWGGIAAALAFVMWLPVIVQQLFGGRGNLSELRDFSSHADRESVGFRSAVDQLVNTVGWPPFLGKTTLSGQWYFNRPSMTTRMTAVLVVLLLCAAAVRWYRAGDRRRVALVVLAGVTAVGGVISGSSVPEGIEKFRMAFFHWTFVLMFFVVTSLVLLAADLLAPALARVRALGDGWPRTLLVSAVPLLVIVVPAVVNPSLDRPTNTLRSAYAPVTRQALDEIGDAVAAERGRIEGPVLVTSRGQDAFVGIRQAVALELDERGFDVVHPMPDRSFVHGDHLVDAATVGSGIVVVLDEPTFGDMAEATGVPGEPLVDVGRSEGIDRAAYDELVEVGEAADEVVFGPEAEALLASYDNPAQADMVAGLLRSFAGPTAKDRLREPESLRLLLEAPLLEPDFDPELVRRLLDSIPGEESGDEYRDRPWRLRIYLLDRTQLLDFASWEMVPL